MVILLKFIINAHIPKVKLKLRCSHTAKVEEKKKSEMDILNERKIELPSDKRNINIAL